MTFGARTITALLVLVAMALTLAFLVAGCKRRETKIAEQLSTLSTAPEQQRLWKQAADQGMARGVLRLDKTDRPVRARQSSAVANRATPQRGVGPYFPPTVTSAVRITTTAGLANADYQGPAKVTTVDASGEGLTLDFGNNKTITFQARVGGQTLGVMSGDSVSVDYRARSQRFNRRQIIAVRAPSGRGIARVTETGSGSLKVSVPLFNLAASQGTGTSVDVSVGTASKTMIPGETAQLGAVTVNLIASRAVTGQDALTLEGSPYGIELIAWSR
jgi:hypothetical protein